MKQKLGKKTLKISFCWNFLLELKIYIYRIYSATPLAISLCALRGCCRFGAYLRNRNYVGRTFDTSEVNLKRYITFES